MHPTLLLASVDGAPLGFALFAPNRDEWLCLAVGFDYADPRSRLTYFGTAYYRAVETAYAAGVTTIGYGQGAWQAKRARGCRPTLMTGWVHSTDPALAAAARASAARDETGVVRRDAIRPAASVAGSPGREAQRRGQHDVFPRVEADAVGAQHQVRVVDVEHRALVDVGRRLGGEVVAQDRGQRMVRPVEQVGQFRARPRRRPGRRRRRPAAWWPGRGPGWAARPRGR